MRRDQHPLAINRFEALGRHAPKDDFFDEWLNASVQQYRILVEDPKFQAISKSEGHDLAIEVTRELNRIGAGLIQLTDR
jgi:hypothetical protein